MSLVTVQFHLNADLYHEAEVILARVGLTMEAALLLFLGETVARGTIPFSYTEEDVIAAKALTMEEENDLCDE
jgi:antitoxin component of RelBE/YafQ-DinJ toxin-antitoxin module